MAAFQDADRHLLHSVANLGYCNPFLTERVDLERAVLGRDFQAGGPVWSASVSDPAATRPNVPPITRKVESTIGRLQQCLEQADDVRPEEWTDYVETVHYLLYHRYYPRFANPGRQSIYRDFLADWHRLCHVPGKQFEPILPPAHLFACFRQIQRAFHAIYDRILGNSMPAARLRASIWQSVFTHDMRRYHADALPSRWVSSPR
ncbi:MAG: hypothetical protein QM757_31785 [Paludibaculum sp.]